MQNAIKKGAELIFGPQTIVAVSTLISGTNHIDGCKEVVLPTIEKVMKEEKGSFMAGKVPTGSFSEMSAELTFLNLNTAKIATKINWLETPLIIHGAIAHPQIGHIVAKFRGYITKTDFPKLSRNQEVETKISMAVHAYTLILDGEKIYEIDRSANICKIMGEDQIPWITAITS